VWFLKSLWSAKRHSGSSKVNLSSNVRTCAVLGPRWLLEGSAPARSKWVYKSSPSSPLGMLHNTQSDVKVHINDHQSQHKERVAIDAGDVGTSLGLQNLVLASPWSV